MSYTYADYFCDSCGKFEAFVSRPVPDDQPCPGCGLAAPWCISAPLGWVKRASATQGKVSKAERKTWTDTEMLADRGSWKEWKAKRKAVWQEHRYQQNKRDGRKGMA